MAPKRMSYDEFIKYYVDWAQEIDFVYRDVKYFIGVGDNKTYINSWGTGKGGKRAEYKTRQELVDNYRIDGKTIKEIFNEIEITGIY